MLHLERLVLSATPSAVADREGLPPCQTVQGQFVRCGHR